MSGIDTFSKEGVRVAAEGCGHGTLNAIYASVERACQERGWERVDLLIIGGDFQSVRNAADLTVMSVPAKYRELGDFHEYYSGTRVAPYLTLFVAGNHEASSHLWELYYGGWVAPNIYYLGAANVLRLGPLRIAGISGIWKGFDYRKPHHERLPFSQDDIKSFYHVRELDVRKLLQIRTQVDVGISHDWPRGIERHGNERHLFNIKPDFERESRDGSLGNPAAEYVMDRLRPAYWFSAHLHCKFSAVKTYDPPQAVDIESKEDALREPQEAQNPKKENILPVTNPDEIDLDMEEEDSTPTGGPKSTETQPAQETISNNEATEDLRSQLPTGFARSQIEAPRHRQPKTIPGQPVPATIGNTTTRFLALDKCLPGRKFLQVSELLPVDTSQLTAYPPAADGPRFKLQYDPEWLAITRVLAKELAIGDHSSQVPQDLGEAHYRPLIEAEEAWIQEHVVKASRLDVPLNFTITAPPHVPGQPESTEEQPDEYTNPQTAEFCELVGVPNLWTGSEVERAERKARGPPPPEFSGGRGRGGNHGGVGGGRGRRGGRGGFGGRGRGGKGRGRW